MILSRYLHFIYIYRRLLLVHIRTHLEYEADFWIGVVGLLLTQVVGLIFLSVLFDYIPEVKGWRIWEVIFLYALTVMSSGLVEIFYVGHWRLRRLVNTGEFDRLLVRPMPPALQLITQDSNIDGFGSITLGGILIWQASQKIPIYWNSALILFFILSLISSVIIIGSINFVTNCIAAFWSGASNSSFPFIIANFREFVKYPITLYSHFMQIMLTWVLPFAFISFHPSSVILQKPGSQFWVGCLTPIIGIIVAFVTKFIWKLGLLRYQGTGN